MISINILLKRVKDNKVTLNELFTVMKIMDPSLPFTYTALHFTRVLERGFISKENNRLTITKKGENLINSCNSDIARSLDTLSEDLRDLYPKGKKGGLYYWRGSNTEIQKKLEIFYRKYGTEYSPKDIREATARYVKSFDDSNRDKAMMLLKYFIEKDNTSTLMSYLENKDDGSDLKIIQPRTTEL